jgi:type II secretory pathway predicted ATPase ExeA
MFEAYWEMRFDPFLKAAPVGEAFESEDYKQASARLRHLNDIKGMGLFTGSPGTGKTKTIKDYADSLNPSLFKVFYLPLSTITSLEFFRAIAIGLGIEPLYKKIDLYNAIQERILSLSRDRRITTVVVLDEAQYLGTKILNDLKILLNFEMDTEKHAVIVMCGLPNIAATLSMRTHEALAQRVIIDYAFNGLSKDETAAYIDSRLRLCGVRNSMFSENSLEALWGCAGGAPRVINSLAEKCLMIGFKDKAKVIDPEIVMIAKNEISLV